MDAAAYQATLEADAGTSVDRVERPARLIGSGQPSTSTLALRVRTSTVDGGALDAVLHRLWQAEPRRRPVLRAVRHPAGRRAGPRQPAAAPERGDRDDHLRRAARRPRPPTAQLNPVDAAAVDALPAGHALLVVQRGPAPAAGSCSTTTWSRAGRHPDSEIFLDDVTVSRRHAEFHRDGDAFTVSDVGSLNGTYVNRDRIDTVAAATTATRSRSASTAWSSSPGHAGDVTPWRQPRRRGVRVAGRG